MQDMHFLGLHCAPYKQPAASIPINKVFNDLYSENRVPIEQVNGSVKSSFYSSRGIRTQIREHKDFELVNRHILACLLLLHNLMVDYEVDDFDLGRNDIGYENDNGDIVLVENETGFDLRSRLHLTYLLN